MAYQFVSRPSITLRLRAFSSAGRAGGWLNVRMLLAPVFGELAFDGGFEDGGSVALEVGLDPLERGDGFVETGELLLDLRDDTFLLVEWRDRNFKAEELGGIDAVDCSALLRAPIQNVTTEGAQCPRYVFGCDIVMGSECFEVLIYGY
ncbi:MAG: hypothetical protein L0177_18660, partial [Chloroflexi bacterium]|nr:hypothetical protein [Chloroflexota bacterium]